MKVQRASGIVRHGVRQSAQAGRLALGLDFGTESVRALLVDLRGREHASAAAKYQHGQILIELPGTGEKLPPDFALQHPQDWIDSAAKAVRSALRSANATGTDVIGIGVGFTSCTMLPALADGTPLCQTAKFAGNKHAWPKLWKHHAAKAQTDRLNAVALGRKELWLDRYGGTVGLEWFFPKMLETLERAPKVYSATEVWLEAGDWFVWQLVGGPAGELPRSMCQAGYKGLWSREDGFPSQGFFAALHPKLENVVAEKMPGRFVAPGAKAGELTAAMAKTFGLRAGIPVSAATIDAHAGVPGCGAAEAGVLVMVLGTSSCHMLNAATSASGTGVLARRTSSSGEEVGRRGRLPNRVTGEGACATGPIIPGVAGIVQDGILPGFVGYETGQAAVGDAFDWLRRTLGHADFAQLTAAAAALPPGSHGVLCLDWFNGCRTPLMDGSLTGAFSGLTLGHGAGHMYRALLEASAFGVKWIVDLLREHGVPVTGFVATGGLPHHNPLLVRIYADVLGEPVSVHPSKHGPALGAAILGALAAGREATGFRDTRQAIQSMASPASVRRATKIVKPNRAAARAYVGVYARYRALAEAMKTLKQP